MRASWSTERAEGSEDEGGEEDEEVKLTKLSGSRAAKSLAQATRTASFGSSGQASARTSFCSHTKERQ